MIGGDDRLRRLSGFLDQWRGLAAAHTPGSTDRLERFLREARPYLREVRRAQTPTFKSLAPSAQVLAALFEQLQAPLARARMDGARLNVWTTAGLKRDEVRNAGVLAALFDPARSGVRAQAFLSAFLTRVQGEDRSVLPTPEELKTGYVVQTEACPLGASDTRVDLSIEGEDFLLLIEVKIDAGEGREQLSRYAQVLANKASLLGKRPALVYLSPLPAKAPPAGTFYADWRAVQDAARAAVAAVKTSDRTFQDHLLGQFAQHVTRF